MNEEDGKRCPKISLEKLQSLYKRTFILLRGALLSVPVFFSPLGICVYLKHDYKNFNF